MTHYPTAPWPTQHWLIARHHRSPHTCPHPYPHALLSVITPCISRFRFLHQPCENLGVHTKRTPVTRKLFSQDQKPMLTDRPAMG